MAAILHLWTSSSLLGGVADMFIEYPAALKRCLRGLKKLSLVVSYLVGTPLAGLPEWRTLGPRCFERLLVERCDRTVLVYFSDCHL